MEVNIKNVSKSFGKKVVLRDVSLKASSGQCIGILGENGSGKSTLFNVMTGLQKGNGVFLCDDVDLITDTKSRNKYVGFVPQNPPLLEELSAKDNLSLWYSKDQLKQELEFGNLKMLGVDEFYKVTVRKMSGGMKKRLSIGCCVANSPKVLLLDEPTSALDIVCKERIYNYLEEYKKNGGIIILATHDIYELQICDYIYVLKNGELHLYEGERNLNNLMDCLKND